MTPAKRPIPPTPPVVRPHRRRSLSKCAVLLGVALALATSARTTHAGLLSNRNVFDPGRDLAFERLTVNDGLPENSVRAMLQDREGFVWLGTQNGLVRYDGTEMLVFTPSPSDSTSFGGRTVDALFESDSGDLWIGTLLVGLWHRDGENGTFRRIPLPSQDGAEPLHVTDICAGSAGVIWVATEIGLIRVDAESEVATWNEAVTAWLPPDRSAALMAILVDQSGRVWCGSEGKGIAILDPKTGALNSYRHHPDRPRSLADDVVYDLLEDTDGGIWVATTRGLCQWQETEEAFQSHRPEPGPDASADANALISLARDADGLLWIGAAKSLYAFDPVAREFRRFANDETRAFSPVNGPYLSVMVDRSGLVWGGSWHSGLARSNPRGVGFQTHQFPIADLDLVSAPVEAVLEGNDGRLWVGTSDNLRSAGAGALFVREPAAAEFDEVQVRPDIDRTFPAVRNLIQDQDGRIFVATSSGLWTVVAGSLSPVDDAVDGSALVLNTGNIKDCAIDQQGRMWIATWEGLWRWDRESSELMAYRHDPEDPHSLSSNDPVRLHVDRSGRLWIGSDSRGLNLYRPETDDFRVFFAPDQGLETISDIHEADGGALWLATWAGLVRFDPATGRTRIFDRRNGLPNDQVVSIVGGSGTELWLSSGFGLVAFDASSGEVRRYDMSDGLPSNEVMFAHCVGADGRAYFGGTTGIVSFDPARFSKSDYVPPVVITRIDVQDQTLEVGTTSPLTRLPYLTKNIELPHHQNDVVFGFASLDFSRPDLNRYRYRLEGAHDNWRDPGLTRRAAYTNLPPDTYVFHVRGSNRDGVWNEVGASIELRILPPWWQSVWAWAAYAALGALLIWGFVRQLTQRERMRGRLAVQRAEAAKLLEIDQLKTRFLTSITHEFRTPLTLIKVPLQRILAEQEEPEDSRFSTMMRNADRLEQLIDQLLDLSRLEARRLPVKWQYNDCISYLHIFASSFDSLATRREITLVVNMPDEQLRAWYDPDLLEKIVGNLLSNAMKHTPDAGQIVVSVEIGPEQSRVAPRMSNADDPQSETPSRELTVTVANSGSFIAPSEQERIFDRFYQASTAAGSGVGLSLVKELTELLGGSVGVSSNPDTGTMFTARTPVFLEHPAGADLTELPRGDLDHAIGVEEPEPDAAEESDSEPRILLVEDNPDLREFMASDLAGEFRILEAADGETGLKIAIDEIPDLVLSDVMMPGMDGFELCRRLKEDERTSHVPVILLTARSETESRHEGLRLGVDDYLAKPFDAEDLRLRIRNVIEQRRKLAERYARRLSLLTPEAMPVTSSEERFIAQLRTVIDDHLDDPEFRITQLCREVAMSRSQLHHKLKGVTGRSTSAFVRAHRLQRAAQLLDGGYGNVTEVALAVGFKNLSYFSRSFRELYGVQPSEYTQRARGRGKQDQA